MKGRENQGIAVDAQRGANGRGARQLAGDKGVGGPVLRGTLHGLGERRRGRNLVWNMGCCYFWPSVMCLLFLFNWYDRRESSPKCRGVLRPFYAVGHWRRPGVLGWRAARDSGAWGKAAAATLGYSGFSWLLLSCWCAKLYLSVHVRTVG